MRTKIPVTLLILACLSGLVFTQGCGERYDYPTGTLYVLGPETPDMNIVSDLEEPLYVNSSRLDIELSAPYASIFTVWITRALAPGESKEDIANYSGGKWLNSFDAPLITLEGYTEAGSIYISIDLSDIPDGYYYVYATLGEYGPDRRKFILNRNGS